MSHEILRLALPNILSNLTIPLLGLVDTAIVGRLEGLDPLGAVALGGTLFSFLYWAFGFLRMGTTGLTAQAYGAGDGDEARRVLARSLLVAGTGAALLLLLQTPIEELAFWLLEASPGTEASARLYFSIRIWAAPATLGLYAFQGWFLGQQDARTPLLLALASNGVNLVLDLVLAWHLGWGVAGIAWGTLAAQYSGLFMALVAYRRREKAWWPRVSRSELLDFPALARFGALGRDILVRSLLMQLVLAYFMARSAASGDLELAVNSVLLQLWGLHAYLVDGFAFAAESLVGRYLGAGRRELLRSRIGALLVWGLGVSLATCLVFWLGRDSILACFTDKSEVLEGARAVYLWTLLAPPVNSVAFVLDGVFLGATAGRAMRIAMLEATLLVYVPAVWWIPRYAPGLGSHGLWLALTAWELARGVTLGRRLEATVLRGD